MTFSDTHLHERYRNAVSHEYRAYRIGQIVQLAMETLRTNEPLIGVGDFNIRPGELEYRVLHRLTSLRDAAAASGTAHPTDTQDPTLPPTPPSRPDVVGGDRGSPRGPDSSPPSASICTMGVAMTSSSATISSRPSGSGAAP